MKNRTIKKIVASLMAVSLIGGGISSPVVSKKLFVNSLMANAEETEKTDSVISNVSLTLDGSIGINLYALIGENVAKAVLSGPNGDFEITDFSKKEADGTYKFTYRVNAIQVKDNITLKLYDESGLQLEMCKNNNSQIVSEINYRVQNYIDDVKEYDEYENDPVFKILIKSTENYCNAAENYFKNTTNKVNVVADPFIVILNHYAPTFGDDIKISLVLDSETAVRFYTDGADVKINGEEVDSIDSKYGKCYEMANIPAHNLLKTYELIVDGKEYSFSPMSYAYRVISSKSSNKKLKEVALTTYMYGLAADEYAKQQNVVVREIEQ